jgi:hypothetical protein
MRWARHALRVVAVAACAALVGGAGGRADAAAFGRDMGEGTAGGGGGGGGGSALATVLARSAAAARRGNPDAGIAGVDAIYRMSAAMEERAEDGAYPRPSATTRGVHEATDAVARIMGGAPPPASAWKAPSGFRAEHSGKHVRRQYLERWIHGETRAAASQAPALERTSTAGPASPLPHQLLAEAPIKVTAGRLVSSARETAHTAESHARVTARTPATATEPSRVVGVPTWVSRLAKTMGSHSIHPTAAASAAATSRAVISRRTSKGWATELPTPANARAVPRKQSRWGVLRHELRESVAPVTATAVVAGSKTAMAAARVGEGQNGAVAAVGKVYPLAKRTALNEYDDALKAEDAPEPSPEEDGKEEKKEEDKETEEKEKKEEEEEEEDHEKEVQADAEKVLPSHYQY